LAIDCQYSARASGVDSSFAFSACSAWTRSCLPMGAESGRPVRDVVDELDFDYLSGAPIFHEFCSSSAGKGNMTRSHVGFLEYHLEASSRVTRPTTAQSSAPEPSRLL